MILTVMTIERLQNPVAGPLGAAKGWVVTASNAWTRTPQIREVTLVFESIDPPSVHSEIEVEYTFMPT